MKRIALTVALCLVAGAGVADEGMWTLDNFPRDAVQAKYGVEIGDDWLSTVQSSITRLEGGCTGSFASPNGLVLTNHHCAERCIAQNSSAERNLEEDGFLAATMEDEISCPSQQISVLMETEEVTEQIAAAIEGKSEQEAGEDSCQRGPVRNGRLPNGRAGGRRGVGKGR